MRPGRSRQHRRPARLEGPRGRDLGRRPVRLRARVERVHEAARTFLEQHRPPIRVGGPHPRRQRHRGRQVERVRVVDVDPVVDTVEGQRRAEAAGRRTRRAGDRARVTRARGVGRRGPGRPLRSRKPRRAPGPHARPAQRTGRRWLRQARTSAGRPGRLSWTEANRANIRRTLTEEPVLSSGREALQVRAQVRRQSVGPREAADDGLAARSGRRADRLGEVLLVLDEGHEPAGGEPPRELDLVVVDGLAEAVDAAPSTIGRLPARRASMIEPTPAWQTTTRASRGELGELVEGQEVDPALARRRPHGWSRTGRSPARRRSSAAAASTSRSNGCSLVPMVTRIIVSPRRRCRRSAARAEVSASSGHWT